MSAGTEGCPRGDGVVGRVGGVGGVEAEARLATAPQLGVSSTLLQLPSVNLYWKAATGTPVIVIDQVSGPVWVIG